MQTYYYDESNQSMLGIYVEFILNLKAHLFFNLIKIVNLQKK
jgi:hypothetical protein